MDIRAAEISAILKDQIKNFGKEEKDRGPAINTINRLFMLTLPAHLQFNHGKKLDPTDRDALRAQIIRSALSPDA